MVKRNYNLIVNTLGQNSFIMYNRIVARRCGVNAAVLLGDLISSGLYWENTEKLADDGFFFKTREDIQNSCCLTPDEQRSALSKLVKDGLVETKKKGIPPVMYYKINYDRLAFVLSGECEDEDKEDNHEENKPLIDKVEKKPKSRRETSESKTKRTLDMVASKLSLTNFSEEVISELLEKFYPRIVNLSGKTVNEDTVEYDIAQLSKCKDDEERMELLELIRHKGWKSIDYDYLPKKNTGSKCKDANTGYGIPNYNGTEEQIKTYEDRTRAMFESMGIKKGDF